MKTPAPERAASRKKLAAEGKALPSGTAPIPDLDYLRRAIRSKGRVDPAKWPALKALIIKRARELGALNAPGVKGTWPFEAANDTEAIDLAAMTARRLPLVRGTADLQASRSAPGTVMVRHRSTGLKIGTVESAGGEHTPVHASGAKGPASSSVPGAMAGLIKMHNKIAKGKTDGGIAEVKGYAGEQEALDFAGAVPASTPAVSSMDGPRLTSVGGGKKAGKPPAMHPAAVAIYRKLRSKKMPHEQALALTKKAMAMHAKASAKAA